VGEDSFFAMQDLFGPGLQTLEQEKINKEHAVYKQQELDKIKADSMYATNKIKIFGLRSKSDLERILDAQNWGPGPEVSVWLRLGGVFLTSCTSFLLACT
jgi:hypothetical protein